MTCELSSHFPFALFPCLASFVLFVLSFGVCFPARVILWSEYSSLTFYLRKSVSPPPLRIELLPCVWLINYSFLVAIEHLAGLW